MTYDLETGEPAFPGQFDRFGRELLPCRVCGKIKTPNGRACDNCGPIKQLGPDRAVLTHDDREMCRVCGELPAQEPSGECRRCIQSIEDERMERNG